MVLILSVGDTSVASLRAVTFPAKSIQSDHRHEVAVCHCRCAPSGVHGPVNRHDLNVASVTRCTSRVDQLVVGHTQVDRTTSVASRPQLSRWNDTQQLPSTLGGSCNCFIILLNSSDVGITIAA